jgi:hypothetical protein
MKPTPQISSNQRNSRRDSRAPGNSRSFPSTDYNFQSTVEGHGRSTAINEKELRTFRKASSEFFGGETSRNYMTEALLFLLITGVSTWSVVSMIAALARLIK